MPFPKLCTTPSNLRSLANSSVSGGFRLRLGALPGPGKTHSIAALLQFEHGCRLSHLTFLFRQVVHDLAFKPEEPLAALLAGGEFCFPLVVGGSLVSRLLCGLRVGKADWPEWLVATSPIGEVEKLSTNSGIEWGL